MLRLLTNFILFGSVLFLPWWVMIIIGIVALFKFNAFYEIVMWGLLADLLYGADVALFYNFGLFLSLGVLLLFIVIEFLKSRIRFYQ